jgi:membrane protein
VKLVLRAAWRGLLELYDSDVLTHAASIAYWALLSLFPFLLLLFSVIGGVTADPTARDEVVEFVFLYFPQQFDFLTGQVDRLRSDRVGIGIGGGLALVWASLGVFNALSSAVNHAWGVERRRSFIRHRLFSFAMMVSAGAIFLAAILLVSAVRLAQARWFGETGFRPGWFDRLGGVGPESTATALLVACVALVFRFVPNVKVRWRDVWPGALVTALLWRVVFALFSDYAADPGRWSVHGSVAAVVVFLLWIYVSSVLLLYGVEMTAAYVRLREAATRHPGLTPVTSAGRSAAG